MIHSKTLKRTTISIAIILICIILQFSCNYAKKPIEVNPLKPGESIVIGTTDRIELLDPAAAKDWLNVMVLSYITHERLVHFKWGGTEIEPGLATHWNISPGRLTYTFQLRDGITFTDGTVCNANAVKYSLDRIFKLNSTASHFLSVIKGVKVTAPLTVEIELKTPDDTFLSKLADYGHIVSPGSTFGYKFTPKGMIGTGPFKLTEYIRGEKIVYDTYPGYWNTAPKVKRQIIKFFKDAESLKNALAEGKIDMAYRGLTAKDISIFKSKGFISFGTESPFIRYLGFNVKKKPYSNILIRQAITFAINRNEIVNEVFGGLNKPLYSMVPPGMWSHRNVYPKTDIHRAKDLLNRAGYSKRNSLEITLTCQDTGSWNDAARVIASNLEKTGMIKVKIESLEEKIFQDGLKKGKIGLFLHGRCPDYIDPDDYLSPCLSSERSGEFGTFFSNQEMDMMLKNARTAGDQKIRTLAYGEIQEFGMNYCPVIPLWTDIQKSIGIGNPASRGCLLLCDGGPEGIDCRFWCHSCHNCM